MTTPIPRAQRLSDLRQFWIYSGVERPDGYPIVGPIHAPERCEAPCAYHSPSDHPLHDAPLGLGIVWHLQIPMRICSHAHVHPDPDGLLHLRRVGALLGVVQHECCPDRCCGSVA